MHRLKRAWNGEGELTLDAVSEAVRELLDRIEELEYYLRDLKEENKALGRRCGAIESPLSEDLVYIQLRKDLFDVEINHYPDGANERLGTVLQTRDGWVAVTTQGRRAKPRFESRIVAGCWLKHMQLLEIEVARCVLTRSDPPNGATVETIPDPFDEPGATRRPGCEGGSSRPKAEVSR
jgi:hypothetical protein